MQFSVGTLAFFAALLSAACHASQIDNWMTCTSADTCADPMFVCCVAPEAFSSRKTTCRPNDLSSCAAVISPPNPSSPSPPQLEGNFASPVSNWNTCGPSVGSSVCADSAYVCCVASADQATGKSTCRLGPVGTADCTAPSSGEGITSPDAGGATTPIYELTWSDEFSGTSLNMSNWSYYLGMHATGANINTAESVKVQNGNLVITPTCQDSDIYSARVETKRKVTMTQGRLEVRAKMPRGNWLWPAIWLWSQGGFTNELDLVEMAGYEPTKAEGSVHLYNADKSNPLVRYSSRPTLPFDMTTGFHVYAMNWTSDTVSYSVDDIPFGSVNYTEMLPSQTLSRDKMFVVLNAAVGGYYFGPEVPNDAATLCADSKKWTPMLVDYARIYSDIS
ncbi:hypothetical protein HDU98_009863 [Podochytrium sp. JEL0797]|nr:hypothetical protein HDU98_009863 [Podochytrium sp. JEL0797]